MTAPNLLYAILLSVAAVISAGIVAMLWPRRHVAGARSVILFMTALTWWSGTYALFWLGAPGPSPFFWLDATYVAVVIVPAALLTFSLEFTGREARLTRGLMLFLTIEPVVTLALLWTEPWHGLFFGERRSAATGAILAGGPAFWFNVIYSYVLILIGCALLIRSYMHAPSLYRRQAGLVVAAVLVPWISNIVSLGGLSPFPGLDLTPLAFTLTGILLAVALAQFHFLDIAPVARDLLVENMSDGVLVLDNERRIVDANPAMLRLLASTVAEPIGAPLAIVQPVWPALFEFCSSAVDSQYDVPAPGGPLSYVDLQSIPVTDSRHQRRGTLVIVRDVTARALMHEERERIIASLQDMLDQVKTLRGLLHACAQCKKVRDEQGNWIALDQYVRTHTDAEFSHGLCPECMHELYPELYAIHEQQKRAILDYLVRQQGSSLEAMSDAIGLSKSSMVRRLESLIQEGRVEEVQEDGMPVYCVPPRRREVDVDSSRLSSAARDACP